MEKGEASCVVVSFSSSVCISSVIQMCMKDEDVISLHIISVVANNEAKKIAVHDEE